MPNKLFLTLLILLASLAAGAQTAAPAGENQSVRLINPEGLVKNPNYTQVIEVRSGRLVFISGQAPNDASGKLVGAGDFRAQAKQVFDNLRTALKAVGLEPRDIIQMNSYIVDMPHNIAAYRDVRRAFFGNATQPPTSTTVGSDHMVAEGALLEVDVIAVAPAK